MKMKTNNFNDFSYFVAIRTLGTSEGGSSYRPCFIIG